MQPYKNGAENAYIMPPLAATAVQHSRPAPNPMPNSIEDRANKAYNFQDQLRVSEYAEELFLHYMKKRVREGRLREVQDVRKSKSYQDQDIDFVCVENSGKVTTYEVKHDTTTTGNLFAETNVNSYRESLAGTVVEARFAQGWLYKSKADRVFYYFEKYREAYMFDRLQFAAWVDGLFAPQNLYSKERRVTPPNVRAAKNIEDRDRDLGINCYYYGIGYTVPLREILAAPMLKKHVWRFGFLS